MLAPLGFRREVAIRTAGHKTGLVCPHNYKADFAHPTRRIVVELDGPSHNNRKRQLEDLRKTTILESLGWRVFRIKHGKEVCPTHLAAILAEF
jgi:very-short-patch-repair endonuclease